MNVPAFTTPYTLVHTGFATGRAISPRTPEVCFSRSTRTYPCMVTTPVGDNAESPKAPDLGPQEVAVELPEVNNVPDKVPDMVDMLSEASGEVLAEAADMMSPGLIGDDDEEDYSNIEPCSPPQHVLNAEIIDAAREKFKVHETDTGSPEYQIATLTTRITYMTTHLKEHPKDFSSTRGLLKMVATRRKLLRYLKSQDVTRFNDIISGMKIRVSQQLREL